MDWSKVDKRFWFGSAAFVVLCIAVLVTTHIIFKPLDNHNEARYGTVTLQLEGWPTTYRTWAAESLPELNRLGPTFRIVDSGGSVIVRNANLQPCNVHGVGRATLVGRNIIEIDPTCTVSSLEFKAVFMHEVGHYVGLTHICRTTELRDCSPVGRGTAVMNPNLRYGGVVENDNSMANMGPVPVFEIQDLDVQEYIRVHTITTRQR